MKNENETQQQYFQRIQEFERERIIELFNNYFCKRNCRNLLTTPTTGYTSYDGTFESGATDNVVIYRNVTFEFKRRNISTFKYSDTFIERTKFKELYKHHLDGNYTLFILEYDDYYLLFDLEYQYKQFRPYVNDENVFFCEMSAAANGYDYDYKVDKQIRWLNYYDAIYILNKTFDPVTYQEFLSR